MFRNVLIRLAFLSASFALSSTVVAYKQQEAHSIVSKRVNLRQITVDASTPTGVLKNLQGTNNADTSFLAPGLDDIHDMSPAIANLWPEYGIRHVLIYTFPDVFLGFGKSADNYMRFVTSHGATVSINFRETDGTNSSVSSPERLAEIGYAITGRYVNGAHGSGFHVNIELFDFYAESDLTNSATITTDYESSFAYFAAFARAVSKASSTSGVGGWGGNRIFPARTNYSTYDPYVSRFYKDCKDKNVPIKAATYHFTNTQFSFNPHNIKTITDNFRQEILVPAGLPNLPVWVTEFEPNPNGILPKSANALKSYNDPAFFTSFMIGVSMYAQDTSIDQVMPWTGFGYGGYGAGNAYFKPWFNLSSDNETVPLNVASAWKLQAELVMQTPIRVKLDGSSPDGFAALAGRSASRNQVQILLNNYQLNYDIPREIAAELAPLFNTSTTTYPLIQENSLFNGEQGCFLEGNPQFFLSICQTYVQVTIRDNESDSYRLVVNNLPWDARSSYVLQIQRVGDGEVYQVYRTVHGNGNCIEFTVPFGANAQDLVTITKV